ncbi:hypothetical protein BaRGS_00036450 [Batillaria attramentaria]|uniref:Novel STAND NTPase 3 domain-containing protein n=1 Tax=Batillaria attramentaria TaxID=370345 RepID=A0ABD0JBF9_9CAEN
MACCLAPEGDLSRIPAAYQKIQDRTKTWISRDQTVYVETEGHRQAVRQLDQRGAVVITGPEGSGKSALGHALLRHYWRHHAHTPLDVRDHEEWCQHVDVRKGRQVVLLDDVFGSEEFSYTSYKTWARDLFHMQDSVRSSAFLVVITIRADVMEEMDLKCNFRDLFRHGPVLDLGSAECFRESEKLEMLRKHVENRDGASVDENKLRDMIVTATLKTGVGFPLQCMILAKDCEAGDEQAREITHKQKALQFTQKRARLQEDGQAL